MLLIFLAARATTQNILPRNFDSLTYELRNAKEDTSRVLLLSQLAVAFVRFERDTALSYAQRAYKLADKINYKK